MYIVEVVYTWKKWLKMFFSTSSLPPTVKT